MKKLGTIHIILIIFLLSSISLKAQYSGLDLLDNKNKKVIPFKYVNGFITITVVYNEVFQLNFLFDTGASHNILFKKSINDILGIEYTDTIFIGGADIQNKMTAYVSRNVPMQLVGTKTIQRDIIVLEKDIIELGRILGTRIDGILGGDFFKGLVVSIDYKRKKITIYDPNKFEAGPNFSEHDITIKNHKPYIKSHTEINGKNDSLKYLIDTGAALALLVHSNRDNEFEIPKNAIIGNLGKGLGGDITGYIGMIEGITIDQYRLPNIITSFQAIDSSFLDSDQIHRDGIIGNVILSRFHVIIDYMREKLYLKQISKLDKEFDYDKSGMLIYAMGENLNQYFIKTIYPNTPAEEAGLLPGDKIIKIGFWSTKFYSLTGILNKLQAKEGKNIKLKILRNGKKIKVEFKLRNLFKTTTNKKGVPTTVETPK